MDIDGVFSGGGIKGLALIGAYQALEEKGYKFKRLAGTSAGAVIAAFIAAGYSSRELLKIMDDIEISKLLDSNAIISLPIIKWFRVYYRLGLYKGVALESWVEEKLKARGIYTFADLPPQSLRVIASDLSNGRLLVLPDDLEKYGIAKETFPVARAIRMSASLPYFFEPVKLRSLEGISFMVDGGVLSNFPMWLFDRENVKKVRPVIGVKLSHDLVGKPKKQIKNAIDMYEALFTTMKDAHDSRYISRKLEKNIIFIPTEGVLTTEFGLTPEKRAELIQYGKSKAEAFLQKWPY
ncbi:patatin-like phospholipase family protein [Rossellomorea aquimaris]|uniref:Patatin-like phospholipase family protein n=1 Tax=Rossellomorea aquimaris TaxID=189382 RepID=A0A5D4TT42_9BACI|nr:patatin-like phospholipase family protein [Rossellomorea aquimaris]TYS77562.1 patatin-like phospholipase family protein [Rossellomorea aquimaris]TYS86743.1 patatin-like phospholipase family protein [Rossellomorea aquimaris]TYS87540.1 patatin-like phospholipase family protein [Rossellomorea aquimaris]